MPTNRNSSNAEVDHIPNGHAAAAAWEFAPPPKARRAGPRGRGSVSSGHRQSSEEEPVLRTLILCAAALAAAMAVTPAAAEVAIERLIEDAGLREAPVPSRELEGWRPPQKLVVRDSGDLVAALSEEFPGVRFVAAPSQADAVAAAGDADAVIGWCDEELAAGATVVLHELGGERVRGSHQSTQNNYIGDLGRAHRVGHLAIGDAAGLVNPMNGEGIDYGLESGMLAADLFIEDPASATERYDELIGGAL